MADTEVQTVDTTELDITDIGKVKTQLAYFDKAKKELLSASDIQIIGDRAHIKKSGWVKLAQVFNLSTAIISVSEPIKDW